MRTCCVVRARPRLTSRSARAPLAAAAALHAPVLPLLTLRLSCVHIGLSGGPMSYEGPGLSTFFERWQLRKVEQNVLARRRMSLSETLPPPAPAATPTAQPAPVATAEPAPAPKKKRGRPKKLPVDGEGAAAGGAAA